LLHGICDAAAVATRSNQNDVRAPIINVDGIETAGIETAGIETAGIETIRRRAEGASYLFVINHTDREVDVPAAGVELLSGTPATGSVHVAAGGVAVVREADAATAPHHTAVG
jgi:beta-galactosidase